MRYFFAHPPAWARIGLPLLPLLALGAWLGHEHLPGVLLNPAIWLLPALLAAWARSRHPHGLGSPARMARRWVPALAVLFALWLTALTLMRHHTLKTFGCDLGIFDNVLWNALNGNGLTSSILGRHFLGEHASPVLWLLTPFYALWPNARLLLAVQAVALAWAALPIYRMTARRLGPAAGLVVLFAYFGYVPLQGIYLFDFHEVAIALPLLAYAVENLFRGRFRHMGLFLFLALLCKEEITLTIVAFGLVLMLVPRAAGPLPAESSTAPRRRLGLAMALAGAAAFLFLTGWLVPGFRQAPFPFVDRYNHLGDSLPQIAWTALTRPNLVMASVFEEAKAEYLGGLFSPVLFLNWLHLPSVLLMLPTLARSLLSHHAPQYSILFHFHATLIPFVFSGLSAGLARLIRLPPFGSSTAAERRHARRMRLRLALVLLFIAAIAGGTQPRQLWKRARRGIDRRPALEQMLALIPADASVCAHNHLVAQLSNRAEAYVYPDVRGADWVLLDFGKPGAEYPLSREEHARRFFELVRGGGYGIRDFAGKFILLERGRPLDADQWPEAVRHLFLEYAPAHLIQFRSRLDPDTGQRFPQVDHAADWLFPAGAYRVHYEMESRRPMRPADRLTLLVHPRWGEHFGEWVLADRAVTAADLPGDASPLQTFTLEFHNPAPGLLALQLAGAKSAGWKLRRITLEPLIPLPEFADAMARTYEAFLAP